LSASGGGTDISEEAANAKNPKRPWEAWVGWLLIIPLAGLARWLAEHGLFFGEVNPVPVRINPLLFLLSAGLAIITIALAWLRWPKSWVDKPFWPFFVSGLLAASFIGLVSAAFPGVGNIVSRETIAYDPPAPPRGTAFAIPILFANNSSVISRAEEDRLRENFEVYRGCEVGNLKVRGFASSAHFKKFSDYRNLLLANDRAKAVSEAVAVIVGVTPQVQPWQSHEAMERNKRIRDIDLAGGRVLPAEARNRRAELFWDDTTCFSPRPADANLRPESAAAQ